MCFNEGDKVIRVTERGCNGFKDVMEKGDFGVVLAPRNGGYVRVQPNKTGSVYAYPKRDFELVVEEVTYEPKIDEDVIVSNDGNIWCKKKFKVKLDDLFYCQSTESNRLYGWKKMKQYPQPNSIVYNNKSYDIPIDRVDQLNDFIENMLDRWSVK